MLIVNRCGIDKVQCIDRIIDQVDVHDDVANNVGPS